MDIWLIIVLFILIIVVATTMRAQLIGLFTQFYSSIVEPTIWQGSNEQKMEYFPTNDVLKKRLVVNKLKVYSVSIFRPKIRNKRFAEYIKGLFNIIDTFTKIYLPEDGWILRIYTDQSLLSSNYKYDDDSDVNSWNGKTENYAWVDGISKIQERKNVQLVKYDFESFKDPTDSEYHIGYFGTVVRFMSMFDTDVELSVFRDINKIPTTYDKNIIDQWIQSGSLFHFYINSTYQPMHFIYYKQKLTTYIKYRDSINTLSAGLLAGFWSVRHISDNVLFDNIIENVKCECTTDESFMQKCFKIIGMRGYAGKKLQYGIDEIVLNNSIYNYAKSKTVVNDNIYTINYLLECIKENKRIGLYKKIICIMLMKGYSVSIATEYLVYNYLNGVSQINYNSKGSIVNGFTIASMILDVLKTNHDYYDMNKIQEHSINIDKLMLWELLGAEAPKKNNIVLEIPITNTYLLGLPADQLLNYVNNMDKFYIDDESDNLDINPQRELIIDIITQLKRGERMQDISIVGDIEDINIKNFTRLIEITNNEINDSRVIFEIPTDSNYYKSSPSDQLKRYIKWSSMYITNPDYNTASDNKLIRLMFNWFNKLSKNVSIEPFPVDPNSIYDQQLKSFTVKLIEIINSPVRKYISLDIIDNPSFDTILAQINRYLANVFIKYIYERTNVENVNTDDSILSGIRYYISRGKYSEIYKYPFVEASDPNIKLFIASVIKFAKNQIE